MNKEKSEKKSAERSRAPRSPKSVRLIVERHYIGNVPMNTLFHGRFTAEKSLHHRTGFDTM